MVNRVSKVLPFVFMMPVFLFCVSQFRILNIFLGGDTPNSIWVSAGAQRSLIWMYNTVVPMAIDRGFIGPDNHFLPKGSREGAVDRHEDDEFTTFQNSCIMAVIY